MTHDVDHYLAGKPPAAVSGRLEVAIDLLRQVDHPALLQSFPTTRKVYTHRFTFTSADQLDADIVAWVIEAHDDVGPGTR